MRKIYLFIIISFFCIQSFAQNDLKTKLLNYNFERLKLLTSAQSLIIDYLKKSDFDSVDIIISFCDSLMYPDSSWLNKPSRFLLRILKEDTSYLKDPQNYEDIFGMADTIQEESRYAYQYGYSPYFYQGLSSPKFEGKSDYPVSPEKENVPSIMYLLAIEKLKQNRKKYLDCTDLWEFLEFIIPTETKNRDDIPKRANNFLRNYPNSKFADLVLYNFTNNWGNNFSGPYGCIKIGYFMYPKNTNKWLPDHPSIKLELGCHIRKFALQLAFNYWIVSNKELLVNAGDTLPKENNINMPSANFGIGYVFDIKDDFFITPNIAAHFFFPGAREKRGENINYEMPWTWGFITAIRVDKRIKRFTDKFSGTIVCFEIGICNNDYSKIEIDSDKIRYYFEFGVGIIAHGKERVFSRNF